MLKVLVINLNTMHTHQIDTFKLNSRLSPWSGQWEKQTFHSSYRAVAASTQVTSETDQHIKKLCKTDNCKRITYLRQLQPDKSMTLSDIRVKLIFGYSVTTSFRETWFKSVRATRSKIAHFCSIHLDIWSILEDLLDCIDLSQVTNNSWRCMSIDIVNLIDISPHHNFVSYAPPRLAYHVAIFLCGAQTQIYNTMQSYEFYLSQALEHRKPHQCWKWNKTGQTILEC